MRPNEIELHIEELVLEGFAHAERRRVADALQGELTRLLAAHDLQPARLARLEGEQLDAGPVRLAPGGDARAAGAQVARAVHRGLTR
jgi:hypothetical protein